MKLLCFFHFSQPRVNLLFGRRTRIHSIFSQSGEFKLCQPISFSGQKKNRRLSRISFCIHLHPMTSDHNRTDYCRKSGGTLEQIKHLRYIYLSRSFHSLIPCRPTYLPRLLFSPVFKLTKHFIWKSVALHLLEGPD